MTEQEEPKERYHKTTLQIAALRAWRESKELTRFQLASASGVTERAISRIEDNDGALVRMETAVKLAKALGLTLKQLQHDRPEGA